MQQTSLLFLMVQEAGLQEHEAIKALTIVADYTKERMPVLSGNINVFLKEEAANYQLKKLDEALAVGI